MKKSTYLLVLLFSIFSTSILLANGIGIIDGKKGVYLTLTEYSVQVEVNNQIAEITTTQIFKNNTGNKEKFKYGFPLNIAANPIGFRWKYGGIWKEASISSNGQDNTIPGSGGGGEPNINLLNYLGSNPFFFSPNDEIENDSIIIIEFRYVELLPYFLGKVNFNYKNDISFFQNSFLDKQTFNFILNSDRDVVNIDLLGLESENEIGDYTTTLFFEIFEEKADFNYTVDYELSSDGLGVLPLSTVIPDSLLYCDTLGSGFVSLIVEPESNVNTEVIEKNFTLIIDRSGSMRGNKIVQARDAASFIVNNLNFGDYFNIIDFSLNVSSFFDEHVEYTIDNQNKALAYINGIGAGGSTNISGALTTAIQQFQVVDTNKANIIIFFTDGEATYGTTTTQGILNIVEDQINITETSIFLFTFGIGKNVNKTLLTLLAQNNKGLVEFVDEENLEEDITRFFLSINNPVLINTVISFDPDIINGIYPSSYPNLYKGQQLILSGRYHEPQLVNMHIEGQAYNIPVKYDFEFNLAETYDNSMSILPKVWAKQKIDELTLDFYLAEKQEKSDSIQSEIDSTSICYGVISSEFTSFEDDVFTEVTEYDFTDKGININISPNPFNDYIEIKIESEKALVEKVNIQVLDMWGKLLFERNDILNGQQALYKISNLKNLVSGIYICKIKIGTDVFTLKIVKL